MSFNLINTFVCSDKRTANKDYNVEYIWCRGEPNEKKGAIIIKNTNVGLITPKDTTYLNGHMAILIKNRPVIDAIESTMSRKEVAKMDRDNFEILDMYPISCNKDLSTSTSSSKSTDSSSEDESFLSKNQGKILSFIIGGVAGASIYFFVEFMMNKEEKELQKNHRT